MASNGTKTSLGAHFGRIGWWLMMSLVGFGTLPAPEAGASCKQPVYIIAHRCNDPDDGPDTVKQQGVNAIEADFSWGNRIAVDNTGYDDEWVVDHEGAFIHSTYLVNWLTDVAAELNRPGSPLSLIVLDIKTPYGPLDQLYSAVRGALGPNVNLVFSIGDFNQVSNFSKIKNALNSDPHAAASVDYLKAGQTPTAVKNYFENQLHITRYWWGDGIAAGAVEPANIEINVTTEMTYRDQSDDCSSLHGVYTWTYEEGDRIKYYLDHGVNGILVNAPTCNGYANPGGAEVISPAQAVAYAKTLPNRKFATPQDNPFDLRPQIVCPSNTTVSCPAPGGVTASDPHLFSFFSAAKCASGYCDNVDFTSDAWMFPVGQTTPVTFTATTDASCSSQCVASVTVQADTQAPAIQCPTPIIVDATSPGGATINYFVGLADNCPGSTISCNYPSGTLVPQGSHTLTCTATDPSSNQGSCSTTVHVKTALEQIRGLQGDVDALRDVTGSPIDPKIKDALDKKLAKAMADLSSANPRQQRRACNDLVSFARLVSSAARRGAISLPDAKKLIAKAATIRDVMGCPESRWLMDWLLNN